MTGQKEYNLFDYTGMEKAASFLSEHDGLTAREILRAFAEQFDKAVDPDELMMGLTVLFNLMP
jgi:hypothetical protein